MIKKSISVLLSLVIIVGAIALPANVFAADREVIDIVTTGEELYVYKLVDTLRADHDYLIVNKNSAGSAYALKNEGGSSDGTSPERESVTVASADLNGDNVSDTYIASATTDLVWLATANEDGFKLSNNGDYLEGKSGNIKIFDEVQYADRYWTYEDSQLKFVGSSTTYTLYYSSSKFTQSTSSSSSSSRQLYIYEKVAVDEIPSETETIIPTDPPTSPATEPTVMPTNTGGYVYKLTDTIRPDKDYLIVNTNTAGSGYSLKNDGGTSQGTSMNKSEITVSRGNTDKDGNVELFIAAPDPDTVWKATANGEGFDLTNNGDYLEGKSGNVNTYSNVQYPDRYWTYNNQQLQYVGGMNTYTVFYSGDSFTASYQNSTDIIYIYEKMPVRTWTLNGTVLTISGNSSMMNYTYSDSAPWGCDITDVIIDERVTSIGDYAFCNCTKLKSITIPDSITSIGSNAFNNCSSLKSITIPDSVTSIGESAFGGCSGLEFISVDPDNPVFDSRNDCNAIINTSTNTLSAGCKNTVIPDTVTGIGVWAFYCCSSLTEITIPASVTSIGSRAFMNCSNLLDISLPDSITSIGYYVFGNCMSLTNMEIPDSVTSIGRYAFYGCKGLLNVEISDSIKSIGDGAFMYCEGLTSLMIPDSVSIIGESAFAYCKGLTSITVDPDNEVFDSRDNCNAVIKTESNTLVIGCQNTVIPNSVVCIGSDAFSGCTGLTRIVIPDSVTSIGDYAFSGCTGLTSVTIPVSVTSIGYDSFRQCIELSNIIYEGSKEDWKNITVANNNKILNNTIKPIVPVTADEVEYEVLVDGTVEITKYNGAGINIAVPSIIDGYTVTSIGRSAFSRCTSLISVTVGNSVTSIGDFAFSWCTNLTSVTISESVTSIGNYTFFYCTSMTSIDISDSVTRIENYAFRNCTSLSYINISASITSIGDGAFEDCTSLTSINISDSVMRIGSSAFQNTAWYNNKPDGLVYAGKFAYKMKGSCPAQVEIKDGTVGIADKAFRECTNLKSITIPDSVTSIGEAVFNYCESLTSVTLGSSVTSIGDYAFQWCTSLKSIDIPDSVTSIGDNAFDDCKNLSSVTIGNLVTSIGDYAFYYCTSLTNVTISDSVTNIGSSAFYGCTSLTDVYYQGSEEDWRAIEIASDNQYLTEATIHFNYNPNDESFYYEYEVLDDGTAEITNYYGDGGDITIPSTLGGYTVTSIGRMAFYYDDDITSITIPNSVTSIVNSAFSGCTSLISITIPKSVTSIGNDAFYDCTSLTSIIIPESVTSIGNNAFYDCTSLASISVSKNNPVYDSRDNCNAIINTETNELISGCKNTVIPDSVTSIGDSAFNNCKGLMSIIIPNSVISIGNSAFSNCTGLTSVTIGNSVTSIGNNAFQGCEILTSIIIPDSVTKIGWCSFYNCTSLADLVIPDSVESIDSMAFLDTAWFNNQPDGLIYAGKVAYNMKGTCPSKVEIKEGTLGIGGSAFAGCTEMTDVTIPDTVTNVGNYAFRECENLESIVIGSSVASIGNYVFRDCKNLSSISFAGNSVTSFGEGAFFHCINLMQINIPSSVTFISSQAFAQCGGLTSVYIPNSVMGIGFCAFFGCTSLNDVYYSGNDVNWNNIAIDNGNESLNRANTHYNYTPTPIVLGDVDGDEEVTSVDVTLIQRFCADFILNIPEETLMNGDVDGSGDLEIVDATYIQRFLAEFNVAFPIGELT